MPSCVGAHCMRPYEQVLFRDQERGTTDDASSPPVFKRFAAFYLAFFMPMTTLFFAIGFLETLTVLKTLVAAVLLAILGALAARAGASIVTNAPNVSTVGINFFMIVSPGNYLLESV
jgi:hypothetical protein